MHNQEIVDYSSNVSQSFQENLQNQFLLQLNQIQSLIVEHKAKMKLLIKFKLPSPGRPETFGFNDKVERRSTMELGDLQCHGWVVAMWYSIKEEY